MLAVDRNVGGDGGGPAGQSVEEGKLLRVDLEDSTVMGYKVFGTRAGDVSYSVKGSVRAYVQYQQTVLSAGREVEDALVQFIQAQQQAKAAGYRSDSPVVVESGPKREGAKSLTEEEVTGAIIRAEKTGAGAAASIATHGPATCVQW